MSAGWERFNSPSALVARYRRYPATFSVLAPYLLLILPPAFVFGNSGVWFLIGVALVAIAGTLIAEWILPRPKDLVSTTNVDEYGRALLYLGFCAIAVSSVVGVAAASAGKGSIAVQVGLEQVSPGIITNIDSLVEGWVVVGAGLMFAVHIGGQCTRKVLLISLSVAVFSKVMTAYLTQRTAPLLEFITFIAMMALLLGVVRARTIVVGILATLIIWPTVFEMRNELRVVEGVRVSQVVTAFDRLRFDLQFARAQGLQIPLDIEVPGLLQHPTPIDILRFGLIPRFVDRDRDMVSTGVVINVALGGSDASAYTFGPVTTAYVLEGPLYLFSYYLLLAVLLNLIWRGGTQVTPVRFVLLALVLSGPLGWFSTFPETIIGVLQNLVSALPLLVLLPILRRGHASVPGSRDGDSFERTVGSVRKFRGPVHRGSYYRSW